jgi:hypothetical protein
MKVIPKFWERARCSRLIKNEFIWVWRKKKRSIVRTNLILILFIARKLGVNISLHSVAIDEITKPTVSKLRDRLVHDHKTRTAYQCSVLAYNYDTLHV